LAFCRRLILINLSSCLHGLAMNVMIGVVIHFLYEAAARFEAYASSLCRCGRRFGEVLGAPRTAQAAPRDSRSAVQPPAQTVQ